MRYSIGLLSLLLLGACSLVPDYARPTLDFTDQWNASPTSVPVAGQTLPKRWWEQYHSPTLNDLVDKALAHNNDLAASVARIAQARADARIARSRLYPSIDATASDSRTLHQSRSSSKSRSQQVGVGVSYELDLFGANRADAEAAEFSLQATEFTHAALALVVASDTVNTYLALLTTVEQQRIARENLKSSHELLAIIEAQFNAGRTSALELAQQKTSVATTEAAIATLVREAEISRHQLAVLTGGAPQTFAPELDNFSTIRAPDIAPILPSALLEQRPDIRAAEAQLQAANANIGIARAAFYPSISIGVDASLVKGAGSALALGVNALAPIFNAGALEGNLEVSQQRKEELTANYRTAVLTAFQEASDALSALKSAATRSIALAEAAKQSQQAYNLARARYVGGATDYQTLLDAQRSLLSSEDAYAATRLEQWQATTNLYKALGGGFTDTNAPTSAP
jgi:outer membrane protein, multidrug efflux system